MDCTSAGNAPPLAVSTSTIRSSTTSCSRLSTFMMRTRSAPSGERWASRSGGGEVGPVVRDEVGDRLGVAAKQCLDVVGDELGRARPEPGEHLGEMADLP